MRTKLYKLMMAQDPKTGGGGGAGGDGGEPSLDDKIAAAVAAALPKALNGAITSHLNRRMAEVEERFKAIEAKKTDDDDDPEGGEGGGGGEPTAGKPKGKAGALSPEIEKRIAAAEKRAERAEKAAAEEKAIREKAVAEGKTREERSALMDALVAAGVQKHMVKGAVALLYGEEKKLKRVADGDAEKVVWAEGDDELSIADGVKAWAKTEVGQSYLPARNAGGSGGTGGGKGGGVGGGQQGATDQQVVDLLLGNTTPTAT